MARPSGAAENEGRETENAAWACSAQVREVANVGGVGKKNAAREAFISCTNGCVERVPVAFLQLAWHDESRAGKIKTKRCLEWITIGTGDEKLNGTTLTCIDKW